MEKLQGESDAWDQDVTEVVTEVAPKSTAVLGRQALNLASKFHRRLDRKKELEHVGMPPMLVEKENAMLRDAAKEYLALLNDYPDVEKDVREPLAKLPDYAKKSQNKIFSSFMAYDRGGSEFLKRTINPDASQMGQKERLVAALFGMAPLSGITYDFCGKLNEKNEQGEYVIADRTAGNFVTWYQASVAAYEAKNMEGILEEQAYFYEDTGVAVEQGILPKSFEKSLRKLNPKSGEYINPEYQYMDMTAAAPQQEFIVYGGAYVRSYFEKQQARSEIQLNLEHSLNDKTEESDIIRHELTHVIAGEKIEFDWNGEAARIFNEGLTESIKSRITVAGLRSRMPEMSELMELEDFGGRTYKNEREVLEFLQSGGRRKIDAMDFYDAYVEQDEMREELRGVIGDPFGQEKAIQKYGAEAERFFNFEKLPERRYGPAQQKLIDELIEAFPECENLVGVGKMLVAKFKSLKETHEQ